MNKSELITFDQWSAEFLSAINSYIIAVKTQIALETIPKFATNDAWNSLLQTTQELCKKEGSK